MQKQNTLLIIDDEVDICLLLERIMKRYYQSIGSSHTLAQAIDKATSLQPTHILLDNNLPDGYGLEFIAQFKDLCPEARIIVISALDIGNEALRAGADAFVNKPLRMNLVKKALLIEVE